MTATEAVLLGAIQGLTEFLPVSSSAHLIFAQRCLPGFDQTRALLFDVTLHLGTLLSVVVYYHRELFSMAVSLLTPSASRAAGQPGSGGTIANAPDRRYALLIIVSMIATALIAFPLHNTVEALFNDPGRIRWVAAALLVTGGLLAVSERVGLSRPGGRPVGLLDAVLIGAAQGLAAVPGISRSGSTISAGLFRGVSSMEAVRFSFLLSIPAILGAELVEGAKNLSDFGSIDPVPYVLGALSAFLVGVIAIRIVIESARRGRLVYFAIYCWVVGIAVILYA